MSRSVSAQPPFPVVSDRLSMSLNVSRYLWGVRSAFLRSARSPSPLLIDCLRVSPSGAARQTRLLARPASGHGETGVTSPAGAELSRPALSLLSTPCLIDPSIVLLGRRLPRRHTKTDTCSWRAVLPMSVASCGDSLR